MELLKSSGPPFRVEISGIPRPMFGTSNLGLGASVVQDFGATLLTTPGLDPGWTRSNSDLILRELVPSGACLA